jgi:hypothetical protein
MSDVDILFVRHLLARFCGSKKMPYPCEINWYSFFTPQSDIVTVLIQPLRLTPMRDLVNQWFATDVITPHTCSLIMHTLVHIFELLDTADPSRLLIQ